MSYLMDTNVLSEWRKAIPNRGVEKWLDSMRHRDDLFISVITIGEICRGVAKLHRRNDHRQAAAIESWLAAVKAQFADRTAPVSVEVAEEWGSIDDGRSLPVPDALIAATARVHGWTLVTRNTKDFEQAGVRVLNPFTD
jgi:predicted nucleic acid-binding protein